MGRPPRSSDDELFTMAVMQVCNWVIWGLGPFLNLLPVRYWPHAAAAADACRGGKDKEVEMTEAREIMHVGATCVKESETLQAAARRMRELDVGFLPICGVDDRLRGIVTDRDIVLKCVAEGRDPGSMTAGQLAQGTPFFVEADADIQDVLQVMEEHRIRRLPVIDKHRLVGVISEADLARHLSEEQVGHVVEAICAQG